MITFGKKTYIWTRLWPHHDDAGGWLVYCAGYYGNTQYPTPKYNGTINLQVKIP